MSSEAINVNTIIDEETLAEKKKQVEKSIQKAFRKTLFNPFLKGISRYELLQPGDKVAVCISGGKDSMLMAKLFQELKRRNYFPLEVVYLVMDPGYNEKNRLKIEQNAKLLGIPIQIFETTIFDSVNEMDHSPCYLCARMRRGHLYSKAKELGCNKIALGHHYDDVIETILMSILYSGQTQTMLPKLHSENYEGMELIRPMYLIREDDILRWKEEHELEFIQCACRFTDTAKDVSEDGTSESKRLETKQIIKNMKAFNPYVETNIFKSAENINLDFVMGYKKDGVKYHYLDDY